MFGTGVYASGGRECVRGQPLIAQFRPPSMAGSNRRSALLAIHGPAPSARRDQGLSAHALASLDWWYGVETTLECRVQFVEGELVHGKRGHSGPFFASKLARSSCGHVNGTCLQAQSRHAATPILALVFVARQNRPQSLELVSYPLTSLAPFIFVIACPGPFNAHGSAVFALHFQMALEFLIRHLIADDS